MESVQYLIEIPHFPADGVCASAQAAYKLENFVDIPDPCQIVRTILWAQGPLTFPAGSEGDITVAVDPGSKYCAGSGFPAVQNPTPDIGTLKTIGLFEGTPNARRGQFYESPNPVCYRKSNNDSLIFAPELSGGYEAYFFLGISWLQDWDIAAPPTPIWSSALDTDSGGNSNICIRQMVTGLGTAWSRLRIRISSKAGGCNVTRASVGALSGSGPNTVATPKELTFVGRSGCVLAPNGSIYSDWINFTGASSLAFTFDMLNGAAANHWAYKASSSDNNYTSGTASALSATMLGTPAYQAARTHVIDQVQVR